VIGLAVPNRHLAPAPSISFRDKPSELPLINTAAGLATHLTGWNDALMAEIKSNGCAAGLIDGT